MPPCLLIVDVFVLHICVVLDRFVTLTHKIVCISN